MGLRFWLTALACIGHLALAAPLALRGAGSPMRGPLLALCLDLFVLDGAALARNFSGAPAWTWVAAASAALLTPMALHLVLAFVGRRRELRGPLAVAYSSFGVIACGALAAFALPAVRPYAGAPTSALVVLVASAPVVLAALVMLRVHLRRVGSVNERVRTYVFLAAFALGTFGVLSYLLAEAGLAVTRLGNSGTLLSTALLSAVVLRFGLFERDVAYALGASALALGCVPVLAHLAAYRYPAAMLVLGTVSVMLAFFPVLRGVFQSQAAERTRVEQLATLGRLSAQMAHDLKNPLAAIKGAAQYLEEELKLGHRFEDQAEFIAIIGDEADRMARVIEQYRRLGRVEPAFERVDVNALARSVVERQALGARRGITLRVVPADGDAQCEVDRDLLAAALENLLRNAMEALPEAGGEITVRTGRVHAPSGEMALVSVEDNGCGMGPRVRERVFEDFFTTKAHGSGLGLAFVRRVMEAHGGVIEIESEHGHGTTVRCTLPIARARRTGATQPHEPVPTG